MSYRPDQELIVRAAEVARSTPQAWAGFMSALKDYANQEAQRCVQSPPEQLTRMQGRAQQCAELATLFADAVHKADSIVNKVAAHKRS